MSSTFINTLRRHVGLTRRPRFHEEPKKAGPRDGMPAGPMPPRKRRESLLLFDQRTEEAVVVFLVREDLPEK